MTTRVIAVTSLLSLAACVAPSVDQTAPKTTDGSAIAPEQSAVVPPPHGGLTTLAWGEEDGGGGTMMTTMAVGEEDGQGPVVTSLAHGEEEDGSGTQIGDLPIILPDPQAFIASPPASGQIASVADIMTRLRLSEG